MTCLFRANGNTLIRETDRGRSFEVTKSGTIVWEYLNPIVEGNDNNPRRMLFYQLQRVTEDECKALHLLPPEGTHKPMLTSLSQRK